MPSSSSSSRWPPAALLLRMLALQARSARCGSCPWVGEARGLQGRRGLLVCCCHVHPSALSRVLQLQLGLCRRSRSALSSWHQRQRSWGWRCLGHAPVLLAGQGSRTWLPGQGSRTCLHPMQHSGVMWMSAGEGPPRHSSSCSSRSSARASRSRRRGSRVGGVASSSLCGRGLVALGASRVAGQARHQHHRSVLARAISICSQTTNQAVVAGHSFKQPLQSGWGWEAGAARYTSSAQTSPELVL